MNIYITLHDACTMMAKSAHTHTCTHKINPTHLRVRALTVQAPRSVIGQHARRERSRADSSFHALPHCMPPHRRSRALHPVRLHEACMAVAGSAGGGVSSRMNVAHVARSFYMNGSGRWAGEATLAGSGTDV